MDCKIINGYVPEPKMTSKNKTLLTRMCLRGRLPAQSSPPSLKLSSMHPPRALWNPALRKTAAIVVALRILTVLTETCNQASALAFLPKASSHSQQQRNQHAATVTSACVLSSSNFACSSSAQTSGGSDLYLPGSDSLLVGSDALLGVSRNGRYSKSARNGAAGRPVTLAMSDWSSSRIRVLGRVRGGGGSVVRSSSTEVLASDTDGVDRERAGQGLERKGLVGALLGVSEHDS